MLGLVSTIFMIQGSLIGLGGTLITTLAENETASAPRGIRASPTLSDISSSRQPCRSAKRGSPSSRATSITLTLALERVVVV